MDFDPKNLKHFQINGEPIACHIVALKKASMFNVLFDETVQKEEPINFTIPDAKLYIINGILRMLYHVSFRLLKSPVKIIIKVVSVMLHMGVQIDIINSYIKQTLDQSVDLIGEIIANGVYHDSLNVILDNYEMGGKFNEDLILNIVGPIAKAPFPDSFKVKIISKMICSTLNPVDFDFIIGVNQNYELSAATRLYNIFNEFSFTKNKSNKLWTPQIKKLYADYLKTQVECEIFRESDWSKFTGIHINGKSIKLIKFTETYTKGTMGCNTMASVVNHISEILLKIESL